ncbi:MAG TPA: DUF1326 domain-containing protein [Steroidobacteraceae bacterium]|jgi:hypothetical protein|nr:DUF1326 domain-containing protein [Steroidobacteraceae bacterium]
MKTGVSQDIVTEIYHVNGSELLGIMALSAPPPTPGMGQREIAMTDTNWTIHGREFANCNCSYGCPCQFNALPTNGNCWAVVGIQIDKGFHGGTQLDGLRIAGIYKYPGPIHLGNGAALPIVDRRANEAQRKALLRIMSGQDTKPGATHFQVFFSMLSKVHDPVFADIDFAVDIDKRRAHLKVAGYIDQRGEPILNPVTGAEHRIRIEPVGGFEFKQAEIGRGWTRATGPIAYELTDSYGQFCELHLCQDGIIN